MTIPTIRFANKMKNGTSTFNTESEKTVSINEDTLLRGAGIFAIVAGFLYIGIQVVHPEDNLSSVQTSSWMIVASITSIMSLFSLIGITGIYLKQVKECGWGGLISYSLFSLFWLISMIFSFNEAFVFPLLTTDAPMIVEGLVGIFGGTSSTVNLGIFPLLALIAGMLYAIGGLLFGIMIYRAKVFPSLTGVLLSFASVVTFAAALVPHPLDRMFAVPMGIALIWLGYELWSNRKEERII